MVLNFSKTDNNDIEVNVLDAAVQKPFSYTQMIKAYLNNDDVTTQFSERITEDEKAQINSLIDAIKQTVESAS